MLKAVVLSIILFLGNRDAFFHRSSKEQHLLKTEISCNTINVFTDNSDEHVDRTMTWSNRGAH